MPTIAQIKGWEPDPIDEGTVDAVVVEAYPVSGFQADALAAVADAEAKASRAKEHLAVKLTAWQAAEVQLLKYKATVPDDVLAQPVVGDALAALIASKNLQTALVNCRKRRLEFEDKALASLADVHSKHSGRESAAEAKIAEPWQQRQLAGTQFVPRANSPMTATGQGLHYRPRLEGKDNPSIQAALPRLQEAEAPKTEMRRHPWLAKLRTVSSTWPMAKRQKLERPSSWEANMQAVRIEEPNAKKQKPSIIRTSAAGYESKLHLMSEAEHAAYEAISVASTEREPLLLALSDFETSTHAHSRPHPGTDHLMSTHELLENL